MTALSFSPALASWGVVLTALVYLCLLFAIAHWGDYAGHRLMRRRHRGTIYALALAVYCTSWTFYGSVGLATRSGLDFLAIYIGPVLLIGLGYPAVSRIVRIAKSQNITSIADFVADLRAPTPSAAAELIVPDTAELLRHEGNIHAFAGPQRDTNRRQSIFDQSLTK